MTFSRLSPSYAILDSTQRFSGGNHGAQAKEIKALKAQVKKLKKGVNTYTHHKAWHEDSCTEDKNWQGRLL
ncbi:hypothetical protein Tco_0216998 [Tanacetum coccineum]